MFALPFILVPLLLANPDRPMAMTPKDTWVGKIVFVKHSNIELDPAPEPRGLQPNADEGVLLTSNQYRVYAERAEYLQIKTREGVLGWVRKSELVPLEDAVAFFTKQIEAKPQEVVAYHCRASAWRFRGEFDAALKDMNEAMRLSPGSTVYNNRGLIWHAKGDYDRAIADFSKALELTQGFALQHVNRANSYLAKKDFNNAIADGTRALGINPLYPEAFRVRGLGHLGNKHYWEAITELTRAIELDARHADAYAERASAWTGKKIYVKALDDFDQAMRLEPNNVKVTAAAALWLASCPEEQYRDGKRALELAQRAQSLARNNSQVMQALAAAHAELGQFAEAVRWQEQAMLDALLKDDATARLRLESYRKKKALRAE